MNPPIDVSRIFDDTDQEVRSDILLLLLDHLQREKLSHAAVVLEDELAARLQTSLTKRSKAVKFHKALLNGDWDSAVTLLGALLKR
jgi:thiamine phosphate synthase YjbQ (UPF0047 family)